MFQAQKLQKLRIWNRMSMLLQFLCKELKQKEHLIIRLLTNYTPEWTTGCYFVESIKSIFENSIIKKVLKHNSFSFNFETKMIGLSNVQFLANTHPEWAKVFAREKSIPFLMATSKWILIELQPIPNKALLLSTLQNILKSTSPLTMIQLKINKTHITLLLISNPGQLMEK